MRYYCNIHRGSDVELVSRLSSPTAGVCTPLKIDQGMSHSASAVCS